MASLERTVSPVNRKLSAGDHEAANVALRTAAEALEQVSDIINGKIKVRAIDNLISIRDKVSLLRCQLDTDWNERFSVHESPYFRRDDREVAR